MAKVTVEETGACAEAKVGDTLLELSKKHQLKIPYSCDGVPSCARCKVKIINGEEFLSPIEKKEKVLIGNAYFITKERLACQTKFINDGEVVIRNIEE